MRASATHVRAAGQDEVYITGVLAPWDANTQVTGWIDPVYVEVPQADVTAITLENSNGLFRFIRNDDQSWIFADLAADETLNEGAVTTLLNQAASVRMTEPIGTDVEPAFGLDQPGAVVTLETATESHTLQVGSAVSNTDNSIVVKASGSPFYVRVSSFTGEAFTTKIRDDFLQAPSATE